MAGVQDALVGSVASSLFNSVLSDGDQHVPQVVPFRQAEDPADVGGEYMDDPFFAPEDEDNEEGEYGGTFGDEIDDTLYDVELDLDDMPEGLTIGGNVPPQFGGLFSNLTNSVSNLFNPASKNIKKTAKTVKKVSSKHGKALRNIHKSLKWATGGAGKKSGAIMRNYRRIQKVKKGIRRLKNQVASHEKVLDYQYGKKRRVIRAVMSAATVLPGIRASSALTDARVHNMLDVLTSPAQWKASLTEAVEAAIPSPQNPTTPTTFQGEPDVTATFDATNVQAAIGALYTLCESIDQRITELETRSISTQAELETFLDYNADGNISVEEVVEPGDDTYAEQIEAAATDAKVAFGDDLIGSITRIMPSQYARKEEAAMEAATKYLLGKAPASAGLLSTLGLNL